MSERRCRVCGTTRSRGDGVGSPGCRIGFDRAGSAAMLTSVSLGGGDGCTGGLQRHQDNGTVYGNDLHSEASQQSTSHLQWPDDQATDQKVRS